MLPHRREMMGEEHCIEDLDQGIPLTAKMLLGPVRDTVRARRLVDLESPDGFVGLVRVG